MNYKEALDLVKDALHQHKEQIYDEPSVMAYSAMEKQIPKKPEFTADTFGDINTCCPRCGKEIVNVWNDKGYNPKYCHYCGQRMDWGDTDA